MDVKIEKGIPVPELKTKNPRFLQKGSKTFFLSKLEVGDSFLLPSGVSRSRIHQAMLGMGMVPLMRSWRLKDGGLQTRIWRVQ
jgi:hypothetical protein